MSERKVGSVTYQEVGEEYFKQRGLRRHAGMWSLWALGVGAVISGEYYGWNFGLGTGGFGGLLIAGRDHGRHVLRPRVLDRGDVARAPPHRRGLLVRTVRDGAVGWVPDRLGREHGIRDHARGRRRGDGPLDADDRHGLFDVGGTFVDGKLTDIAWWNSLPVWMAVFYVIFVWINYVGSRRRCGSR
jgi:ethanolamine permease